MLYLPIKLFWSLQFLSRKTLPQYSKYLWWNSDPEEVKVHDVMAEKINGSKNKCKKAPLIVF